MPSLTTVPATTTVQVMIVLNCAHALAAGTARGIALGYDTARPAGSTGAGTDALRTAVAPGDRLVWSALPLECEAFAEIAAVDPDPWDGLSPPRPYLPAGPGAWQADVTRALDGPLPYRLSLRVGTRREPLAQPLELTLVPAVAR